ncbi:hypothetical protein ACFL5O_05385 [Myxococcota bacterium]
MVSKSVPTARVGPNDLPLMLSIAPIPEEYQKQAVKLWNKMAHSARHRGSKSNRACQYVESYVPTHELGATNTTGSSVRLIAGVSGDVTYLRQPSLKKLLVVSVAQTMGAEPGDGSYAELWQAVW